MRVLIIPFLLCIAAPALVAQKLSEPANPGAFELEGDKLGERLSSFVSRHPKAQCVDSTKKRKNCYQWVGVSVLGIAAHADSECSPETHSLPGCVQGLTAQFVDEHLALLTYAVGGTDKTDAAMALKKKYGNPLIDTHEATIWSIGNATMSVVVGRATEGPEGQSLITFMIQG